MEYFEDLLNPTDTDVIGFLLQSNFVCCGAETFAERIGDHCVVVQFFSVLTIVFSYTAALSTLSQ